MKRFVSFCPTSSVPVKIVTQESDWQEGDKPIQSILF